MQLKGLSKIIKGLDSLLNNVTEDLSIFIWNDAYMDADQLDEVDPSTTSGDLKYQRLNDAYMDLDEAIEALKRIEAI